MVCARLSAYKFSMNSQRENKLYACIDVKINRCESMSMCVCVFVCAFVGTMEAVKSFIVWMSNWRNGCGL